MGPFSPLAMGCMRFSYLAGISTVALKIVSGSTSWGMRTSMYLLCRWQLAHASFPVPSRGFW
eukprot:2042350-Lingulodinium_polyedra.AAC.1